MRRVWLNLGSSRVRLAMGLLLSGVLLAEVFLTFRGAGVVRATQLPLAGYTQDLANQSDELRRLEHLAKTDHVALLKHCLQHYRRSVRDYACTLTKQERLGGTMSPVQVIDVKFKEAPFSVLMSWRVGAVTGDKMLYVENDPNGDNKMYIHLCGALGMFLPVVARSPDDPMVRAASLRSIKEFGFARGLASLIDVYEQAQAEGHLLEAGYLGVGEVDGRKTFALRRVLPPGFGYPAKTTVIDLDQEYLVPVRITGTDWQNQDLCSYRYTDIRFNADLPDSQFTRQANGL